MKKILCAVVIILWLVLAIGSTAQTKPWTRSFAEWSIKDITKVLNDSPWAQTQVVSDTSAMTYNPSQLGGTHQVQSTNYYIRFLSAKPIRQALYRTMELSGKASQEQLDQARKFVDREFQDSIVVTVLFESADPQYNAQAFSAFSKVITSTLQNNTYLEVKTGRRLFLQEYQPPGPDGLGAKFIFPRLYNGEPFVNPGDKIIRFVVRWEPSSNARLLGMNLNMQFKVADMMYNGVLEY